jgi:hypothetical protein
MIYFKYFIKVCFCLAFFILVNTAFAQQIGTSGNSEYLSVDSLINRYEKLKRIRIYYQPEWFENKKVHVSTLNFSLDEFLYKLTQSGKCSLIAIDSSSFVLVLPQVTSDLSKEDVNSVILIGKMQDYGKYKKATISGKIVDGKNGDPLPGASLFIEKINARSTSDKNGNYSMEVPVGEYDVKLNFVGFQESSRKIKLVSPGKTNFELFEKSVNLNEVVVTSERAEQNVSRTQMSLVKMDAKTIKELPVSLGEVDIIKSVTLLPGVQSTGEFGTGFFVRGGGADQNLILLEDEPVFNSSHLFGLTSIVNPDGIANVTLYKGGIPAKYGERASSVLDIRLGSSNQDESKVKGSIGLINSKINMDIPFAKNKANLFLGGRTTYSDWILHKTSDIDLMNSSARFSDLNALFVYNLNKNNKITLFGYYSKDRFKISNSEDYSYFNTLASFRWNHVFSRNVSSVFVTGFSKYNYDMSEVDSTQRDESYKIKSSLLYKNLKYNVNWTPGHNHSIDLGVNGILYNENSGELSPYDTVSLVSPIKIASEKALEYGIYASDNITISDKLGVEVGLRYSGYEFLGPAAVYSYEANQPKSEETIYDTVYYGNNKKVAGYSGLEPRVSVRFTLNGNSSLKASYNRVNQYINLVSNTTVSNPSDIWKLSDKYVKPLICDQFALGYFRNFKNNMFETSVELYYKKLKNIIEYKDGASLVVNPTLDADLLNARGYNYGMELYLKKSTGRLTGWLTYTYSRSMRQTYSSNSSEQINNNAYFPSVYDKPHNFNWIGNYHISRRWRFSWSFSYSTGRPVTLPEYKYYVGNYELVYYSDRNKYRLPDYHRLDISITRDETLKIKKFWKGSWTFALINVYGRKNYYSTYFDRDGSSYDLYALYIIGRPLPTLTYNFSF